MADAKNKNYLINKIDLANIAKTGKITTDITKSASTKADEKLYISVKQPDETAKQQPTSPSENISVLFARDRKTGKTSYLPATIKKYEEMKRMGKLPEEIEFGREPVGKYLEKQFSKYEIDFNKAIKSRDNSNLGLIAMYITKANENNDQVALGIMTELISKDPNFEFAFVNGKLDLDKLKDLSLMNEQDVENGYDNIEELEELSDGRIDASKASAEKIAEIADQDIKIQLEDEIKATETSLDEGLDDSETEEEIDNNTNKAKQTHGRKMATIVARLSAIKNISARRKVEASLEKAKTTAEQSIAQKAKARAMALANKRKDAKTNSILNNLIQKSDLLREDTEHLPVQEKAKKTDRENKAQLEDRARQERERIAKEKALEKAKAKQAAGKKLNTQEQELIEADIAEKIRIGEEKMKQQNTFGQYEARESVGRIVEIGRESAARIKELGNQNTREMQEAEER